MADSSVMAEATKTQNNEKAPVATPRPRDTFRPFEKVYRDAWQDCYRYNLNAATRPARRATDR